VAVGDNVYFASHDGVVHCRKADTGAQVWKFATAGYVFAPPTIWQGRVLIGGGDGRVYCLDAATGRASGNSRPRRLIGGVLLRPPHQHLAGAVWRDRSGRRGLRGGRLPGGERIYAYGLDAKTGQVVWEKDDAGTGGSAGLSQAYSAGGHVALGGGRMWLCSSTNAPGSFALTSGDWKPVSRGGQYVSESAVLADKWVIQGGRRLSETQDTINRPLSATGFTAYSTTQPGPACR